MLKVSEQRVIFIHSLNMKCAVLTGYTLMQVTFILQQLAAAAMATKWIMGSDWQAVSEHQLGYCQGARFEHSAEPPVR